MFTLIELIGRDWTYVSLGLNVLSDCIFFGALYWGHRRAQQDEVKVEENE